MEKWEVELKSKLNAIRPEAVSTAHLQSKWRLVNAAMRREKGSTIWLKYAAVFAVVFAVGGSAYFMLRENKEVVSPIVKTKNDSKRPGKQGLLKEYKQANRENTKVRLAKALKGQETLVTEVNHKSALESVQSAEDTAPTDKVVIAEKNKKTASKKRKGKTLYFALQQQGQAKDSMQIAGQQRWITFAGKSNSPNEKRDYRGELIKF